MKLGQQVKVKTIVKDGFERIVNNTVDGKVKTFTIIGVPNKYTEYYTILIDSNMLGWTINKFHIDFLDIDKKYLGKKFFDIDESFIVK